MQNLKKAALALCLAACVGFGFSGNVYANEVMPSSGIAHKDLNREIHKLEMVYSSNKYDWASVTDLSLLYYDRGEYANCYKMSKRALKLYEDGYAYESDDDILRESLVKGAAAAYNLGEYRNAEKMLNTMISLNLRGSDENAKTYMGWAYYYLSNIERIRGNYNRSHFYGGIAIDYCPHYSIFIDYWDCFYRTGAYWHWRHHHHHDYRPPMPPPRPHHYNHRPHQEIHKPGPSPLNRHSPKRNDHVVYQKQHTPVHQPKHDVHRTTENKPVIHQSKPSVQHPVGHKPSVQPKPHAERQHQKPSMQQHSSQNRPSIQHQSRPVVHQPAEHNTSVQPKPHIERQHQKPSMQQHPSQNRPSVQHQSRPRVQQSTQQGHEYQPVQPRQTSQPRQTAHRSYGQGQSHHGGQRRR